MGKSGRKSQLFEVEMALTGEYQNVIDEKGRLMIPAKLRSEFGANGLYVTRGIENNNLMVLPSVVFDELLDQISGTNATSMFDKKVRTLQRALITPAEKLEFDSNGRIIIPQRLRALIGLEPKSSVLVLGVGRYLELWKKETYDQYLLDDCLDIDELTQSLYQENKER